ncbi:hypothetical protein R6Q57_005720 [Mikania cordata]
MYIEFCDEMSLSMPIALCGLLLLGYRVFIQFNRQCMSICLYVEISYLFVLLIETEFPLWFQISFFVSRFVKFTLHPSGPENQPPDRSKAGSRPQQANQPPDCSKGGSWPQQRLTRHQIVAKQAAACCKDAKQTSEGTQIDRSFQPSGAVEQRKKMVEKVLGNIRVMKKLLKLGNLEKKHEINDKEDDEIRKTERKEKHEGRSDEEDGEVRRRETKCKDRRSDDEDVYKDRRRREMTKNTSDGEDDKYTKIRDGRDDEDDSKNDGNKRSVRHDLSLEEVAETRKSGRNHEKSDDKIRKMVRKGILEERSDDDDIRKKRRRGKDRRSDDEDDYKDRRRRDRHKNRSDDEDDKYKKRRDSRKVRRSNGDHKDRRRSDQKNDKNEATKNLDEGPRFQKLAKIQEGMTNLGKSGGVYIPPFKLARMMTGVQDKSSIEYQRMTWDALRISINGLVNKVNATNKKNIIPELFAENLIRGRGLFCRSCMKSQMASPGFTDVFAALVAVVNTKFPVVGELLLRRIILQLQRAYKRNDKHQLLAAVKFIAHLVNQQVVHELIALELLTLLLENSTDDSVEVAVGFVTECGSILQDLSPKGLHG